MGAGQIFRQARAVAALAGIALAAAGCIDDAVITCADGSLCPAELACGPAGGCVEPARLCDGRDGEPCDVPGGVGVCSDGLCVIPRCGDGRV